MTRTFKKEFLIDVLGGCADGAKKVSDEIIDQRRWSTDHWMVFECDSSFWGVSYSHGSTESQDERPFEYEDDDIECQELVKVEKTVTVYEPA